MSGPMIASQAAGGALKGLGNRLTQEDERKASRNDMRQMLNMFLAQNPFDIAKQTAELDAQKSWASRVGGNLGISPKAWNQLGSTNENLLGINRSIEDFASRVKLEDQKQSWWKQMLGGALSGLGQGLQGMGSAPGGGGGAV